MGLAMKIVLLLVFVAVADLIVFFILFFLRPIATTVWLRRIALRRAGVRKTKVTTTVGEQVVWHGGSGPLLVLLHGAGDQAGTWYKVAPELKRHFQLVIPDLAGHGESDPVAGVLSLGTLLTALEQVLDAMPWRDAPLVLAGNSLGAWMAMLYAQKHPAAGDAGDPHRWLPHQGRIGDRHHAQGPRRGSAYARCHTGPFHASPAEFRPRRSGPHLEYRSDFAAAGRRR